MRLRLAVNDETPFTASRNNIKTRGTAETEVRRSAGVKLLVMIICIDMLPFFRLLTVYRIRSILSMVQRKCEMFSFRF